MRRVSIALRKAWRRVVYSRSSTHSIAAGVALGVLVAFTPTMGFQMIIAAALATVFGFSRLAAILPVWITNPFTMVPIYCSCYLTGSRILPGAEGSAAGVRGEMAEFAAKASAVSLTNLWTSTAEAASALARLGADILWPFLLGAAGAAASYPAAFWAVSLVRRMRRRSAVRRAERRLAELERVGLMKRHEQGPPGRASADPPARPAGAQASRPLLVPDDGPHSTARAAAPGRAEDGGRKIEEGGAVGE
jgi:hypothetical protein